MSRAALGWLCRLQRPQQHCVQRQRAAQGVALRSRCGCEYACRPRTRRCFFALAEQHNNWAAAKAKRQPQPRVAKAGTRRVLVGTTAALACESPFIKINRCARETGHRAPPDT